MNDFINKLSQWLSKIDIKGAATLAGIVLVLINQALSMQGKGPLPISDDQLNYWVSTTLTGIVSVVAYVRNNSLVKGPNAANVNGGDQSEPTKK